MTRTGSCKNCVTSQMNERQPGVDSSSYVSTKDLRRWCAIPAADLLGHPELRVRYRQVADSAELGALMARELVEVIEENNKQGQATRAIIPCGPACWYEPFGLLVNQSRVSLKRLHVFHMDECLDWQGKPLPSAHPYNFKTFMERHFYGGIRPELAVPGGQRHWLLPGTMEQVLKAAINQAPLDITVGGWGQDGHVAYNQARRHPFHHATLEDIANSTIRIQENNIDTIIALAQRTFGAAYQFVPANVDHVGNARVPFCKESSRLQRHGRLEANCAAGRFVQCADTGIPDDAAAGASRRNHHVNTGHGSPSHQRKSRLGVVLNRCSPCAQIRNVDLHVPSVSAASERAWFMRFRAIMSWAATKAG